MRSLTSTPCMLPLREWEGALIAVMEADRCLFTCDRVPAHAGATEGEGQSLLLMYVPMYESKISMTLHICSGFLLLSNILREELQSLPHSAGTSV